MGHHAEPARVAYVDGHRTETVSAWELGLFLGRGAFETLRSAGSGVRALELHARRLVGSLDAMGLALHDVAPIMEDVRRARGEVDGDALLRAIVYPGANGLARLVLAEPHAFGAMGRIDVVTAPVARTSPRAKLTSYGVSWQAIADAARRGATEALFVDADGTIVEGATSNVFATVGDRLLTAPDDGSLLAGVTRHLVLACADDLGVDVSLRRPTVAELTASGGFVTSTKRGVTGLRAIDGREVPASPLIAALSARYEASLASESAVTALDSRGGRFRGPPA